VYCLRKNFTHFVIPDLIRNPVFSIWIPAFAEILKRHIILHLEPILSNTRVKVLGIFETMDRLSPILVK